MYFTSYRAENFVIRRDRQMDGRIGARQYPFGLGAGVKTSKAITLRFQIKKKKKKNIGQMKILIMLLKPLIKPRDDTTWEVAPVPNNSLGQTPRHATETVSRVRLQKYEMKCHPISKKLGLYFISNHFIEVGSARVPLWLLQFMQVTGCQIDELFQLLYRRYHESYVPHVSFYLFYFHQPPVYNHPSSVTLNNLSFLLFFFFFFFLLNFFRERDPGSATQNKMHILSWRYCRALPPFSW